MTVTRNLMLEQAFSDRISTLKHHDNGSSMAIDLIEKTTQELAKTAAVNQDVYDFALQYVEEQVNFFEKQSSLINTLHSFFTAMPPEVRVMYNTYLGDTKGAAYMVICKHLDPQFNPPWTYLNLGDIPGLLVRVDTMLNEITQMGAISPLVTELITYLSNVSGVPGL